MTGLWILLIFLTTTEIFQLLLIHIILRDTRITAVKIFTEAEESLGKGDGSGTGG